MKSILLTLALLFAVQAQSQELRKLKASKEPIVIEAIYLIEKHATETQETEAARLNEKEMQAIGFSGVFELMVMIRPIPEGHKLLIEKLKKYQRSEHPLDVDWAKAVGEFIKEFKP